MNLQTQYLGLTLKNPLMPGASPMVDNLDTVRRLEDAGASAIVMHSLFEEQVLADQGDFISNVQRHKESFSEAQSFIPAPDEFGLSPDLYLLQIARIKEVVDIPVIASLNGITLGGWINHAQWIERAGADAIELNFYYIPTDPEETGASVLERAKDVLKAVKARVGIPVALKLSPFFSALPHSARELVDAGADGLVLFNRFYQPDIDIESLDVVPTLQLSDSSELNLRLRWLAILTPNIRTSYALTGGVHTAEDVIKSLMVGAHTVQMVSALLTRGAGWLGKVLSDMTQWLDEHEYDSLDQLRGSMSLRNCPNPAAFERGNYLRILQGWSA